MIPTLRPLIFRIFHASSSYPKCLCWMLVRSITSINITESIKFVSVLVHQGWMAHYNCINFHRFNILSSVFKLSPFFRLLDEAEKFTVSALSLFWASSKLIFVLVEFSKNKLTIVTPCKDGTFLIGRSSTSLKLNAVSIMVCISSLGYPSTLISVCFLA